MFKTKYYFLLIIFTYIMKSSFAQSFTYSGPMVVTIPYGNSVAAATYSFSYSNLRGLCYPGLIIAVDGVVINNDLCHGPSTPSSYTINFTGGTHSVQFSLLSINCKTLNCYDPVIHQTVQFTVNCKFQISIENIFGGGMIYVDGNRPSPVRRTSTVGDNVSIGAIEQDYNGYHWIWNNSGTNNSVWYSEPSGGGHSEFSSSQNTSYSVQSSDLNTKVIAGLRKVCNISFQNNFNGGGNGGVINVGGTQYTSPTSSFQVVEQNSITATAIDQTYAGESYVFYNWSNGDSQRTTTVYPTEHSTIIANFIPHLWASITGPYTPPCSLSTWTAYGHSGFPPYTYQWYYMLTRGNNSLSERTDRIQPNALWDTWLEAGTDQTLQMNICDNYHILRVDVTDSRGYTASAYRDLTGLPKSSLDSVQAKPYSEEITDYTLEQNYPNPFNPTTKISFSLPEASYVTLKVYDVLGREIAVLVDENKPAGRYEIQFDASELPSGIYFYRIAIHSDRLTAGNKTFVRKMLLIK
ncbi:T9SS type A sorting domain-containing protein [Melioribacteraceae bacterium 4301-Me]|uniref:T9SS type A sorting domain-containing protein n=1 Tax=Pyranulibacter aquaticus TaxID=3163344 RepID=UPI00359BE1DA